jgi:hypothetical protein
MTGRWRETDDARAVLRGALIGGTLAAVASTAAAILAARAQAIPAAGAVNAVSHWAWGDAAAARQDRVSVRYTLTGLLTNHAASIFWAFFYERLRPRAGALTPGGALARGAAVSGIAYLVDYHVVPRRLTPGYELRLSNRSLALIYGAIALALPLCDLLRRRRPAAPARTQASPAL